MRRRRRTWMARREALWCLVGIIAVQIALAIGVDHFWPATRDPEFRGLTELLRDQRALQPHRPLALLLGSSRTQAGVQAGRLSSGETLVFNFGIPGAGPMMQQVALRRLLAEGVRPDLVVIEVMPVSFSQRDGSPIEERQLDPARLSAAEVIRLVPRYHEPQRLLTRWALARLCPCYRHQAELREAIAWDAPIGPLPSPGQALGVDSFGWRNNFSVAYPETLAANVELTIHQYERALANPEPASAPFAALRDLLDLCRRKRLTAALVLAPECRAFRERYDAGRTEIDERLRTLAAEYDLTLHDARGWVDDAGFCDGHHLGERGAEAYTERVGRDILAPLLDRWALERGETDRAVAAMRK